MGQGNQAQEAPKGIGTGGVLLFARALACSVEVFLHKPSTFGERYLGLQAGLAVLVMLLMPTFAPTLDPQPLWWFLGAFLLAGCRINGTIARRRKQGRLGPHSFYTGTPWLGGLQGETATKRILEPAVVWGLAALAGDRWPLLGNYLVLAGIGLFLSVNLAAAAERRRVLDMHDAYMEQRRAAEEWRSMHGD